MIENIGLGVICQNEKLIISDFHEHIKGKFKEMVYLDGGSTDGTFEELLEYQAKNECKLYQRPLNFDFGAQRNHLCRLMKSSWIMMVDSDERLNLGLWQWLGAFQPTEVDAYYILRAEYINHQLLAVSYQGRLFKNLPEIKWGRRIHECLMGYKNVKFLGERSVSWQLLIHDKTNARQEKQNIFYSNFIEQRTGT